MKLMYPEMRVAKLFLFVFALALFSGGLNAQTKRTAAKPTAKKTTAQAKDAKKKTASSSKKAATAKTSSKDTKKKATASRKNDPKSKAADKKASAKNTKKMTAAERRKEAARKKAEEARRAAALAEQRRREQAAREARARKLAFERGLRTETAANILKDNTDGEDLTVRQVAVNALGERAGTVVVMDAKTGKIVTMVNQAWAIKEGFKPCSTIKLVTGVAGLNENRIEQDGTIAGDSMRMDLDDALAYSNNAYFQRVGVKMGTDKMISYARRLGLGEKTGINAEGEYAGKLPYGNSNPRIYSHADDFEVTPLQLAVMVTAISNGGNRVVPQFQRSRVEKTSLNTAIRGTVDLPDAKIERVIPGMIGAAEYGTARRGVDQSWGVAGKTGSCIGRGSWVGLFASVAPVEDPKYSVVVITRGEGERGRIAAGIAGQIYRALAPQLRRDQSRYLALKQKGTLTNTDRTLATVGDEEEEEEDEEATTAELGTAPETAPDSSRPIIVAGTSQRPINSTPVEPKKTVVRTAQSQPKTTSFPPVVIQYKKDDSNTTVKPAVKPAAKPLVKPTVRSTPKTTTKPVIKSTGKPSTKPTAKPTAKSNTKSTAKPVSKTTAKSTAKPSAKPTAKTTSKSTAKPAASGTRPRVVTNK